MKLRPHHSLCMQFFEGKGYSEEFTQYMWKLLALPEDTRITITTSFDYLCEHCPNHPEGICTSESKVRKYDNTVMELCGFKDQDIMTLGDFKAKAKKMIIDQNLLPTVCENCGFLYICGSMQKHA